MLPITLHPDKFGFYTLGKYTTYSKLEAIELHNRLNIFPEWNFNDHVFENVDWFTEPTDDLFEMYKKRCRQIREAYDYCVIFYSGGSDSDNILRAWLESGCKIDEIATIKTLGNNQIVSDYTYDWALEIDNVVEPVIQQLKKQGVDFNYRVIDSVNHTVDFIERTNVDLFYYANNSFSPNNTMKSVFRETIKDYKDIINKGKKLCFIWGSEKPRISYRSEKQSWYVEFLDIFDNCVGPYIQNKYHQGWYDELFYWTPDYPEMIVKQVHSMKNFIEHMQSKEFYQINKSPYGYNKKLKMFLTHEACKIAIYPKWDPRTFVARKPYFGGVRPGYGYLSYSERDKWFFQSNQDLREKYEKHFLHILNGIKKHSHYNWHTNHTPGSQNIIVNQRKTYKFA